MLLFTCPRFRTHEASPPCFLRLPSLLRTPIYPQIKPRLSQSTHDVGTFFGITGFGSLAFYLLDFAGEVTLGVRGLIREV